MRAAAGSARCPTVSRGMNAAWNLLPSLLASRATRTRRRGTWSAPSAVDDGDVGEPPPPTPPPPRLSPGKRPLDPFYSSAAPPSAASRAAASSAGTTLSPTPRPARVCGMCEGRGDVACAPCSGKGRLPRGGYSTKNALNANKAVGTTWTALQRTLGRTHFDCRGKRVIGNGSSSSGGGGGEDSDGGDGDGGGDETKNKRKKKKKKGRSQTYFLMVATCDDSISLWVPAATLKDRSAWASGWLERKDLLALREAASGGEGDGVGVGESGRGGDGGEDRSGASCRKCNGTGRVPCPLCSRAGDVIEV